VKFPCMVLKVDSSVQWVHKITRFMFFTSGHYISLILTPFFRELTEYENLHC
jgi:hypothetical protein